MMVEWIDATSFTPEPVGKWKDKVRYRKNNKRPIHYWENDTIRPTARTLRVTALCTLEFRVTELAVRSEMLNVSSTSICTLPFLLASELGKSFRGAISQRW